MATATVTKKDVRQVMDGAFSITFNLVYANGSVLFDRDYSVIYKSGGIVSTSCNKIQTKMQYDINAYKAEQQIYNSSALGSAVVYIQTHLEV